MYNADRLLTHVGIRNQLVRGGGLQRAWLCAQRRSIEFWPQPSQLMESGVRRPQSMASPRCMMAGQKNRVSRPMAPGGTGVDPEPRCWDEPKNPGPWPLARLAARFATCLFRTAPKPAEGSSGAARRDFRSSGQPCGIDVTLISSEQQQASVIISQISGGCRGLSRFAIAMFLETVVNKRACVAEPQQPGGQPARRVPKSVPALLSKLIGLCKPTTQPSSTTARCRAGRAGLRLLVYQILIARVAGRGSLRDEMNCQCSAATPGGFVLSLPQLWRSGNRNVTSDNPSANVQSAFATPRIRGPRGKTTEREVIESSPSPLPTPPEREDVVGLDRNNRSSRRLRL